MSIQVTCLQCGSSHQVNDRLAGRRVRCPKCETAVHVPELPVATLAPVEPELVEPELVEPELVEPEIIEPEIIEPEIIESESPGAQAVVPAAIVPAGVAAVRFADTVTASSLAVQGDDDEDGEVLPRSDRPEEEMDMTPMVDVTFLLLIFFMVTAAFSLQKSIQMPRQQTDAPSSAVIDKVEEELDQVEVQVDEFGSFLVMAPDWERETPSKQNLISALRESIAGNKEGARLIVKVHEMAKLKSLVIAMDAGTIAGFAELQVTQVEGFD